MYKVNFSANQFEIHQMYGMNGLSIKIDLYFQL